MTPFFRHQADSLVVHAVCARVFLQASGRDAEDAIRRGREGGFLEGIEVFLFVRDRFKLLLVVFYNVIFLLLFMFVVISLCLLVAGFFYFSVCLSPCC